jgi:transcriptional regulator with XRE-family HTH domain
MRQLRQRQDMTLDALAERSGLTKGYISRLENFRVSPSLPALSRIAQALGVPMSAFFQTDYKAPSHVFGSLEGGREVDRDDASEYGLLYRSLAFDKLDRIMDPFVVDYGPCDAIREMKLHDADEFFLVLEGSIDYFVCDMDSGRTLSKGETVYLSRNIPHTAALTAGCPAAKALIVYCRPAEEAP